MRPVSRRMEFPICLRTRWAVALGILPSAFWIISRASYSVRPGSRSPIPTRLSACGGLQLRGRATPVGEDLIEPQRTHQHHSRVAAIVDVHEECHGLDVQVVGFVHDDQIVARLKPPCQHLGLAHPLGEQPRRPEPPRFERNKIAFHSSWISPARGSNTETQMFHYVLSFPIVPLRLIGGEFLYVFHLIGLAGRAHLQLDAAHPEPG